MGFAGAARPGGSPDRALGQAIEDIVAEALDLGDRLKGSEAAVRITAIDPGIASDGLVGEASCQVVGAVSVSPLPRVWLNNCCSAPKLRPLMIVVFAPFTEP